MAYNEILAERLRAQMDAKGIPYTEKKMFGGLCFLYEGKMCVGIVKDDLMSRVLDPDYEASLKQPHVREMDFTGRTMKNFVFVEEPGWQDETALLRWIELGVAHAKVAAAKVKKKKK
jgi:TfoX/Sxy family transcriptional regulator of competence genes